jgi:hypothetical protein
MAALRFPPAYSHSAIEPPCPAMLSVFRRLAAREHGRCCQQVRHGRSRFALIADVLRMMAGRKEIP